MGWLWSKVENVSTAHFYKRWDSKEPFATGIQTTHLPFLLWWGGVLYMRGRARSRWDADYVAAMDLEEIRVVPPREGVPPK